MPVAEKITKKPDTLPAGVTHLHGNFYTVPLRLIVLADGGFDHDTEDLVFTNPRYALTDYQIHGQGFDKTQMAELEESIRSQGLLNTPICRWHDDNGGLIIQAVDCERRVRSLRKLVAANEQCWDKEEHDWKPAKELYENVVVQIDELDAFAAFTLSFNLGERTVGYGDGAVIQTVAYLREKNVPPKKIQELTGYGSQWLKQTDDLIAGTKDDEKLFLALCGGEISRAAALKLIEEYPTVAERQKVLFELKGMAQARYYKAGDKDEIAEAAAVQATLSDPATADGWVADVDNSDPADADPTPTPAATKKKKAKVTTGDVKKVTKKKDEEPSDDGEPQAPKPLTATKVEKFWWEKVTELVKAKNQDDEGEELEPVDMRDLRLTKFLCEQFRKGNVDIVSILKNFKRKMDKEAAK